MNTLFNAKYLVILSACFLLFSLSTFAQFSHPFEGTWSTSFGLLHLKAEGENISGDYVNANGTIEGIFYPQNKQLKGSFFNAKAKRHGNFEFTLNPDGKSFAGKWGWEVNKWIGAWNGTLQSKPSPSTSQNPSTQHEKEGFKLSNEHPVVVVLIHGKTAPQHLAADQFVNTENHIPYYWGYPFVKELLGGAIYTQSGQALREQDWTNWAANKFKMLDPLLLPHSNYNPSKPPPISLFGVYRDGSLSLVAQTKQILAQIDSQYKRYFGNANTPVEIVFVAHSMGGLMGRIILTNPTEPIAGESFNATDHQRANFIRDRVRYMLTIATPHDGTRLANKGMWMGENAQKYLDGTGSILDEYNPFKDIESLEKLMTDVNLKNPLETLINDASQALSDNLTDHRQKATQQATTTFWRQMNQTTLAPHKARRQDGTLVPIYTMSGRQPDWNYFSIQRLPNASFQDLWDMTLKSGFTKLVSDYRAGGERARRAGEATFMILGDLLHHNVGSNNTFDFWGAPPGCCNPKNRNNMVSGLDKVRRIFFTINPAAWDSQLKPWSEAKARPDEIPMFYWRGKTDDEIDYDGVVHFDSAMGLRLGKDVKGKSDAWYFDHTSTYPIGKKIFRGSWYRLLSGPWEFDNHGNLQREARNGQWIYRNLVGNNSVGPYASANGFSGWTNPTPKPQAYAQGMDISVSPSFESGKYVYLKTTNKQFKTPSRVNVKWYVQEGSRGNKQLLALSQLGQTVQRQLPCAQNLIVTAEAEDAISGEKASRFASTACQLSEKTYLFHVERSESGTVRSNGQVQSLNAPNLKSVVVGDDANNVETILLLEFDFSTVSPQYTKVVDAKLIFTIQDYQNPSNMGFRWYQVDYGHSITAADFRNKGGLKSLPGAGNIDFSNNRSTKEMDVSVALEHALKNRADKKLQFVVLAYQQDSNNQADYIKIAVERPGTTLMPSLEMTLKR